MTDEPDIREQIADDPELQAEYDHAMLRMLTGTRWCIYCGAAEGFDGACPVALDRRQDVRMTMRWEDVYEGVGEDRRIVNRRRGLVFVPTATGLAHYVAHGLHDTALQVWEDSAMWRELAGLGDRTRPGVTPEETEQLRAAARARIEAHDWRATRSMFCECGHHKIAHELSPDVQLPPGPWGPPASSYLGCRLCECDEFSASR